MPTQIDPATTTPTTALDPASAWAPYQPDARRPWNPALAGHLYRRAGFGADWSQLQAALADGPQKSIDRLLEPDADVAEFNRTYDRYASSAGGTADLRAWWLRRMILTPHPLLEKMTLFWHGHFGISNHRVGDAELMARHVGLLRADALGSFATMMEGVSQDPAVLLGLGSDANRKAQPNEKLPREFFRQFSMGEGNYTEQDVEAAARAMTGWFVLNNRLRYIDREHDPAAKRIFGQEGPWERADVVRITLAQPAAPRLVVRKLYRWLISETDDPGDALIDPLAESFARDYDVAGLVGTMLRSNLFFSPEAYRRRIKGPVEFAMGIIRGLEGLVPTLQLGGDLADLGQDLYCPPTVKGWLGGRDWINKATMAGRTNLASALVSGQKPYGDKLDPGKVAEAHGRADAEDARGFFIDLFLQGDVPPGVVETLPAAGTAESLRRFLRGLFALPEFQLA
jgi:uncharacterized protein (DUF1800 family)